MCNPLFGKWHLFYKNSVLLCSLDRCGLFPLRKGRLMNGAVFLVIKTQTLSLIIVNPTLKLPIIHLEHLISPHLLPAITHTSLNSFFVPRSWSCWGGVSQEILCYICHSNSRDNQESSLCSRSHSSLLTEPVVTLPYIVKTASNLEKTRFSFTSTQI